MEGVRFFFNFNKNHQMKKRRIIPVIPYETFIQGSEKEKHKIALYDSILEAVEQGIKTKRNLLVIGRIDYGNNTPQTDIEIFRDSWKDNLQTILEHYEHTEEYEKCSRVVKLMDQI